MTCDSQLHLHLPVYTAPWTSTINNPPDIAPVAAAIADLRAAQIATDDRLFNIQAILDTLVISHQKKQGGPSYPKQSWISRNPQANRILLVTIYEPVYPVTIQVLEQVFSPRGYVENIEIIPNNFQVQAHIHFQLLQDAIRARDELQGRNIYDGCCRLDIQFFSFRDLIDMSLDSSDVVETVATTTISQSNKSEIEAPSKVVQVLTPQSIQIMSSNEGLTAKIERNRLFQVAAAIVNEVTPNLISNEQHLGVTLDACIHDFECEKLASNLDAHLLLDEMPKWKTLLYNDLVQVKDHLYFFLPNFEEILAKKFGSINRIETRKSAPLILMRSFLVVHDPGGNNQVFDVSKGGNNRQNKMTQMLIKYGHICKHMCAATDSLKEIGRDELHVSFGYESEHIVVNEILLAANEGSAAFLGTTLCKLEIYFVQFVFDPGGSTNLWIVSFPILEDKDHFKGKGMS